MAPMNCWKKSIRFKALVFEPIQRLHDRYPGDCCYHIVRYFGRPYRHHRDSRDYPIKCHTWVCTGIPGRASYGSTEKIRRNGLASHSGKQKCGRSCPRACSWGHCGLGSGQRGACRYPINRVFRPHGGRVNPYRGIRSDLKAG